MNVYDYDDECTRSYIYTRIDTYSYDYIYVCTYKYVIQIHTNISSTHDSLYFRVPMDEKGGKNNKYYTIQSNARHALHSNGLAARAFLLCENIITQFSSAYTYIYTKSVCPPLLDHVNGARTCCCYSNLLVNQYLSLYIYNIYGRIHTYMLYTTIGQKINYYFEINYYSSSLDSDNNNNKNIFLFSL